MFWLRPSSSYSGGGSPQSRTRLRRPSSFLRPTSTGRAPQQHRWTIAMVKRGPGGHPVCRCTRGSRWPDCPPSSSSFGSSWLPDQKGKRAPKDVCWPGHGLGGRERKIAPVSDMPAAAATATDPPPASNSSIALDAIVVFTHNQRQPVTSVASSPPSSSAGRLYCTTTMKTTMWGPLRLYSGSN